MAIKPVESVDWATGFTALKLQPTAQQKTWGWTTHNNLVTGVPEKPTLQHQNGWQYNVKLWINYLESVTDELIDEDTEQAPIDSPSFTTKVLLPNGTVGVPSIGFASDDDGSGTGFYRPGPNSLGFAANGINVGGYSSPGKWIFGPTTGLGTSTGYHTSYGAFNIRNGSGTGGSVNSSSNIKIGSNIYRAGDNTDRAMVTASGVSYLLVSSAGTGTAIAFDFVTSSTAQTADATVSSVGSKGSCTVDGSWVFGPTTGNISHTIFGKLGFNKTTLPNGAITIDIATSNTEYTANPSDVTAATVNTLRIGNDGSGGGQIIGRTNNGASTNRGLSFYAMTDNGNSNSDMLFDVRQQDNLAHTTLTFDAFRFRTGAGTAILSGTRLGIWTFGGTAGLGNTAGYHTSYGAIFVRNGTGTGGSINSTSNIKIGANVYRSGDNTDRAMSTASGTSFLTVASSGSGTATAFDFKTSASAQTADTAVASTISVGNCTVDGAWTFGANTGGASVTHVAYGQAAAFSGVPQLTIMTFAANQAFALTDVTNYSAISVNKARTSGDTSVTELAVRNNGTAASPDCIAEWRVRAAGGGMQRCITISGTGNIQMPNIITGALVNNVTLDGSNNLLKVTSSKRYKTDIKDIEGMNPVWSMRPITYRSKLSHEDQNRINYGFIAEEMAEISKILTIYADIDGEYIPDSVSYTQIIVPLVSAVQELKSRIEILEAIR